MSNSAAPTASLPPSSEATPPVCSPLHYLFVAGLGRRQVGDPATIRAALTETMQAIAATCPQAQPVAMASGAAGGDQLFLEAAQRLGWPIRLVLPVPVYLFEQDFTSKGPDGAPVVDQAGLDGFRRLHAAAVEVEVISPSAARRESFTRCANTLVTEADIVVALWDRQPGKQGGTNESLFLAEKSGVPTIVLDAQTGRAFPSDTVAPAATWLRRYEERHAVGTILHDIDEAFQHTVAPAQAAEFASASLAQQHKSFGGLLADEAAKCARSYKRKNLAAVALHVGASFFGLWALLFFVHHTGAGLVASVVKLTAVAAAFWLAHSAKKLGEQNKWVKARFIREVNRSLGASAEVARQTGDAHGSFVPTSIWVIFRYLRAPLLFFHARHRQAPGASSLLSIVQQYRRRRLQHDDAYATKKLNDLSQQDYQQRTAARAECVHHRIETAYLISLGLFLVSVLFVLAVAWPHLGAHHAEVSSPSAVAHVQADVVAAEPAVGAEDAAVTDWLGYNGVLYRTAKWLTVLLPVVAAALLVLPNLWDVHRRRRVAPAMVRTLVRLDAEAAQVEEVLIALAGGRGPALAGGVAVWAGTAPERQAMAEAWARTRFASIAREAEHAILTEVIGFKTFVENVELG